MSTLRIRLNCKELTTEFLHARPIAYLNKWVCKNFPNTEFSLRRDGVASEVVNPRQISQMLFAEYRHGEELILETSGDFEDAAAEFFRIVVENFGDFSDNPVKRDEIIKAKLDEYFLSCSDPELDDALHEYKLSRHRRETTHCTALAMLNYRLHDRTAPLLPRIAELFDCRITLTFDLGTGVPFEYVILPSNPEENLDILLSTRIPVAASVRINCAGAKRAEACTAVKAILDNLLECDDWLRSRGTLSTDIEVARDLVMFATQLKNELRTKARVYDPQVSDLLRGDNVYIEAQDSEESRDSALQKVMAPLVMTHGLKYNELIIATHERLALEPIILREGFAVPHASLVNAPRIALSIGIFPNKVAWDGGRKVTLIAYFLFAADTKRTYVDYLQQTAKVFKFSPGLHSQLCQCKTIQNAIGAISDAERLMRHKLLESSANR